RSAWRRCVSAWARALPRCWSASPDMTLRAIRQTKWLRRAGVAVLIALAGTAVAPAADGDYPALQAVAKALPDAQVVAHSSKDFATYPLITERINQRGGIKGNIAATRTVEGNLGRSVYQLAEGQAPAVIAAVKQALSGTGFKALYDCVGEACGPTFIRASPGFRLHRDLFNVALGAQHYLALE